MGPINGTGSVFAAIAIMAANGSPWPLAAAPPGEPAAGVVQPDGLVRVSPEEIARLGILTEAVRMRPMEEATALTGTVRPLAELSQDVSSRHDGRLVSLHAAEGDRVNKGDPLAEIDSPGLALRIFELRRLEVEHLGLRGELSEAESRVQRGNLATVALGAMADIVEEDLARLRGQADGGNQPGLFEKRLEAIEMRHRAQLAQADLEQSRRDVQNRRDRAAAVLRAAQALRDVIGPQISPPGSQGGWASDADRPNVLRLTAPISGVVQGGDVAVGRGIVAGWPLLRIVDLSIVRVEAEVPPGLWERLAGSTGRPARLIASAAPALSEPSGMVIGVSPALDEAAGTGRTFVQLENANLALRTGATVEVEVWSEAGDETLAVPREAVREDKHGPVVFVLEEGGYRRAAVRLGAVGLKTRRVLGGLNEGDLVVTAGVDELARLWATASAKR